MTLTFRMANINDIDQLIHLRVLMQLEVHHLTESSASSEFIQRVKTYLEKSLREKTYHCAIALAGEQIVGTAGVCFYEKPPGISGGSGLTGYVTNVFTLKDYRQKGIGKRLMIELSELAYGMNADKLHLGATADGINLYKAVGYTVPKFLHLELSAPFSGRPFAGSSVS